MRQVPFIVLQHANHRFQLRNSFGNKIGGLIEQLQSNPNRFTLSLFKNTQREFACLTALQKLQIGRQQFYLIGGLEIDATFLNELKVDETKVNELIASAASAYEDPKEVIEYYATNKELNQQMQNVALEEQAVELLVESAKVKDKKASFKDIMNPEGK